MSLRYCSNHERPIELLRSDRRREINKAIREDSIRMRSKGFRSLIDVRSELKSEIVKDQIRMTGVAQVGFIAKLRFIFIFCGRFESSGMLVPTDLICHQNE